LEQDFEVRWADTVNSRVLTPVTNKDGSITLFSISEIPIELNNSDIRKKGTASLSGDDVKTNAMIAQYLKKAETDPLDYESRINLTAYYYTRYCTLLIPADLEGIVKFSDQALEINKDDSTAYYMRGIAYSEMGDSQKAIDDLYASIETNPSSMKGAYYMIGQIEWKRGNIKAAIEAFETVYDIDPEFNDITKKLEEVYALQS
jgi:tetratricopeptide (TPR) repeat protein